MKRAPIVTFLLLAAVVLVAMAPHAERNRRVELYVALEPSGAATGFELIQSDAPPVPFVLPSNMRLVVTDVMLAPLVIPGFHSAQVFGQGSNTALIRLWQNSLTEATLHLPFSTGIVFNSAPVASAGFSEGALDIRMLGYLERD